MNPFSARSGARCLLLVATFLTGVVGVPGAGHVLVDLNQYGHHPSQFVRAGDRVFYAFDDAETGVELWVKEPSAAPRLVRETVSGPGESHVRFLRRAGDRVVFGSTIGGGWESVWGSDGTESGTVQIIDPIVGGGVAWIIDMGPRAWICTTWHDGIIARGSVWISDGTKAGTTQVVSGFPAQPFEYVHRLSDGVVVFPAFAVDRNELWRSDGTASGTSMIGAMGLFFDHAMTVQDGRGLFCASPPGEVYKSVYETDGTAAGTRIVIPYVDGHWQAADPMRLGSRILLHMTTTDTGRELFTYDTIAGTLSLVSNLGPGATSGIVMPDSWDVSPYEGQFVELGGRVVFPGWNPDVGMELFITDGTPGGTGVVKDIAPGAAWSEPRSLLLQDGLIWFTANDGVHGDEMWVTDGTSAGTRLAADLRAGPESSFASNLTDVDGDLYLSASTRDAGPSAWVRPRGSMEFAEIDPRQSSSFGSGAGYFLAVGRWLVFRAPEPEGISYSIWRSDGTAVGTERILGPILYSNAFEDDDSEWIWAHPGHALDERWFIFRIWLEGEGWRYWLANVETGAVRRFGPEPTDTNKGMLTVDVLTVRNGRAYFKQSSAGGYTVFWSQGIADPAPGGFAGPTAGPSDTVTLGLMNDRVTIWRTRTRSGDRMNRVWFGPGNGAGSPSVVWQEPGVGVIDPHVVDLGDGRYLFEGPANGLGNYLWATDGTSAGTRVIGTDDFGMFGIFPIINGSALYGGQGGLLACDGTEAGTRLVMGPSQGVTAGFVYGQCNGLAIFTARDADHGEELWRSDGTTEGTFMIADLTPGPESTGFTKVLTPIKGGEVLYFAATPGVTTFRTYLFRTDGTAAGTFLLPMSGDGPLGLEPKDIVVAGSRVFFTAVSYGHGREPWVFELPTAPSRLANVSTRGLFPATGDPMIAGLVLEGAGQCRALLRGVGPALRQFGVSGSANAPSIRLMRGGSLVLAGTRFSEAPDPASIAGLESELGAFSIPRDEADSVAAATLSTGSWTMHADAGGGSAGTGLAELYVTDEELSPVNISTRGPIDATGGSMVVGFVLEGGERRRILFRGVGPGLAALGVQGTAADPRIDIYDRTGVLVGSNDTWGQAWNSAEIAAAIGSAGAFGIADDSTDACVLLELDPGAYTMHVRCASGAPGTALGEVYLVPAKP